MISKIMYTFLAISKVIFPACSFTIGFTNDEKKGH